MEVNDVASIEIFTVTVCASGSPALVPTVTTPLESTSIHLIHSGLIKQMDLFPDKDFSPLLAQQYNTAVGLDFETIRDFLVLHYKVTERTDSDFWNYCRNMSIPSSLQYKIDQFVENGRVVMSRGDLFQIPSWLSVMIGQGLIPKRYDPLANLVAPDTLAETLAAMRTAIADHARRLPLHSQYLRQMGMEVSEPDPSSADTQKAWVDSDLNKFSKIANKRN